MNVGELKELLSEYDDETPVVLASDEEGNDFHWLDAYGDSYVKKDTTHLYRIWGEADILEEQADAAEYGDEPPEFDPILVLWP